MASGGGRGPETRVCAGTHAGVDSVPPPPGLTALSQLTMSSTFCLLRKGKE